MELKIILLDHQKNYVGHLSMGNRYCKIFYISIISLNVLHIIILIIQHNYFQISIYLNF